MNQGPGMPRWYPRPFVIPRGMWSECYDRASARPSRRAHLLAGGLEMEPAPSTAATATPRASVHHDAVDCCIVGGGPAGAMLALLLARQGLRVTLLEQHHDFDRDFRGDTLHPSVM